MRGVDEVKLGLVGQRHRRAGPFRDLVQRRMRQQDLEGGAVGDPVAGLAVENVLHHLAVDPLVRGQAVVTVDVVQRDVGVLAAKRIAHPVQHVMPAMGDETRRRKCPARDAGHPLGVESKRIAHHVEKPALPEATQASARKDELVAGGGFAGHMRNEGAPDRGARSVTDARRTWQHPCRRRCRAWRGPSWHRGASSRRGAC